MVCVEATKYETVHSNQQMFHGMEISILVCASWRIDVGDDEICVVKLYHDGQFFHVVICLLHNVIDL